MINTVKRKNLFLTIEKIFFFYEIFEGARVVSSHMLIGKCKNNELYSPVERSRRRKSHAWRMTYGWRSSSWYCDTAPTLTNPHKCLAHSQANPHPKQFSLLLLLKTTTNAIQHGHLLHTDHAYAVLISMLPSQTSLHIFAFFVCVDTTLMTVCHSTLAFLISYFRSVSIAVC